MKLSDLKHKLLQDPRFRAEYERYDLAFEIGQMVLEARMLKGITQQELAEIAQTKQSGIARLEAGNTLPSLSFLDRVARALKTKLRVSFDVVDQARAEYRTPSATHTTSVTLGSVFGRDTHSSVIGYTVSYGREVSRGGIVC